MMQLDRIKSYLDRVKERYNGDFDVIAGAPVVTWADQLLAECLSSLLEHVINLSARVNELEDPTGKNSR